MTVDVASTGQDSREAILQAAERLMTTVGYDNASIARICRESGLPVGSVYHHFGSKAALLGHVVDRVKDRFFAGLPTSAESPAGPDAALGAFWAAATEAIVENYAFFRLDADLLRLSHQDEDVRPVMEELTGSSRELVATALLPFARTAGVSDAAGLTRRMARAIVAQIRGIIMYAGDDPDILRREMADCYPIVHDVILPGWPDPEPLVSSR